MLIFRAFALTIPAVTVEVKLNGLPTAKTHSPTLSASEFPKRITGSCVASILSNAMSVLGSAPTRVALNVRLSLRTTSISLEFSIT